MSGFNQNMYGYGHQNESPFQQQPYPYPPQPPIQPQYGEGYQPQQPAFQPAFQPAEDFNYMNPQYGAPSPFGFGMPPMGGPPPADGYQFPESGDWNPEARSPFQPPPSHGEPHPAPEPRAAYEHPGAPFLPNLPPVAPSPYGAFQQDQPRPELRSDHRREQPLAPAAPNTPPANKTLLKQRAEELEEGELSEEGEIYEPTPPTREERIQLGRRGSNHTRLSLSPAAQREAPVNREIRVASESPTAPPLNRPNATYNDRQPVDALGLDRSRSKSYSPYLSPREVKQTAMAPAPNNLPEKPRSQTAGLSKNQPSGTAPNTKSASQPAKPAATPSTLTDARLQAEEAIVNLWSLDVRYKQFIDEGIDTTVLKNLLSNLGLGGAESKPKPPTKAMAAAPAVKPPMPVISPSSNTGLKVLEAATHAPGAEERKDRIARKLAERNERIAREKAEKAAAEEAEKAKAEDLAAAEAAQAFKKTETLQQKLEALQRARELAKAQGQQSAETSFQDAESAPGVDGASLDVTASARAASQPLAGKHGNAALDSGTAEVGTAPVPPPLQSRQSASGIPGLFLSSTPLAANPQVQPVAALAESTAAPSNQRKRPVASDLFNDSAGPAKRPFGQSRSSALVIDISDESESDDDDDVEMEIESQEEGGGESAPRPGGLLRRTTSIRDFPPLTDTRTFHGYNTTTPSLPNSAAQTPPVGKSGKQLTSLTQGIADLKRKIAEAEAKKMAAGGGPSSTRDGSAPPPPPPPKHMDSSISSSSAGDSSDRRGPSATRDATPPQHRRLAFESVPLPKERAPAIPHVPVVGPPGGGVAPRPRPTRLASEQLPMARSAVERKLAMLDRLRDEMARLEHELDAAVSERDRLEQEAALESSRAPPEPAPKTQAEPAAGRLQGPLNLSPSRLVYGSQKTALDPVAAGTSAYNAGLSLPRRPEAPAVLPAAESAVQSPTGNENAADSDASAALIASPAAFEDGGSAASPISPHASLNQSASPVSMDTKESGSEQAVEIEASDVADDQGKSEGEITASNNSASPEGQDSAPMSLESSDSSPAAEPATDEQPSPIDEQPMDLDGPPSPAIAEQTEKATPEDNVQSHSSDAESMTLASPLEGTFAGRVSQGGAGLDGSGDLEPQEMSLIEQRNDTVPAAHANRRPSPSREEGAPNEGDKSTIKFTPYKSPLLYFHSYRFHPEFAKNVSSGLRSLTFSNNIDAKREVCPDELAGHDCTRGEQCPFQHFKSMVAPDDHILMDLGDSENYSGERRQQFIQGLKEVLQGFRVQKVRDFDAIAKGIIEYRSRFLADPSRVLPLDGVNA